MTNPITLIVTRRLLSTRPEAAQRLGGSAAAAPEASTPCTVPLKVVAAAGRCSRELADRFDGAGLTASRPTPSECSQGLSTPRRTMVAALLSCKARPGLGEHLADLLAERDGRTERRERAWRRVPRARRRLPQPRRYPNRAERPLDREALPRQWEGPIQRGVRWVTASCRLAND